MAAVSTGARAGNLNLKITKSKLEDQRIFTKPTMQETRYLYYRNLNLRIRKSLQIRRSRRTVFVAAAQTNSSDATTSPSLPRPTEWVSKTLELPALPRGSHVIHRQLLQQLPEISEFEVGFAQFFIQHTSASLTISENASPDVPLDLADALDKLAPDNLNCRHIEEGPDDMSAHIKSCLMGSGLLLPIAQGRLALGIWQGIYLNEHRNYGGPRKIVVTIQGQKRADGRKYGQYQ